MTTTARFHRRTATICATAAAAVLTLCLCAAATPANTAPTLSLGPATITNNMVTFTGTVGASPSGSTVITVNGQPVGVGANGTFTANADLTGRSSLDLTIKNTGSGETDTISIPLNSNVIGPDGVIPATVLDSLRQAGATLTIPPGGFSSVDQQALHVIGTVADPNMLSALKLNGTDAMSLLQPNGSFAAPVPGSDKSVTITATDTKGVSQSSTFPVQSFSSTINTKQGTSVAATGAVGVKIAVVKYATAAVKAHKRITMTVTIKDKRGYLVRGAKVRINAAAFQRKLIIGGQQAKQTNTLGRASFTIRLRAPKFNQRRRLFTVTNATTPTAHAARTTSVRVPKLTKPTKGH